MSPHTSSYLRAHLPLVEQHTVCHITFPPLPQTPLSLLLQGWLRGQAPALQSPSKQLQLWLRGWQQDHGLPALVVNHVQIGTLALQSSPVWTRELDLPAPIQLHLRPQGCGRALQSSMTTGGLSTAFHIVPSSSPGFLFLACSTQTKETTTILLYREVESLAFWSSLCIKILYREVETQLSPGGEVCTLYKATVLLYY